MNRYTIIYDECNNADVEEDPEGEYVLYEEAISKITPLRIALVDIANDPVIDGRTGMKRGVSEILGIARDALK